MPRYIDADLIDLTKYKIGRSLETDWIDIEDVKRAIALTPTADVVPKSEVERWRRNLEAVLEEIAETKKEVAREIFAEIERTCVSSFGCFYIGATHGAFAELKKKYTEEFYETKDSHESL